jgi:CRISPR-associated protein Cas6
MPASDAEQPTNFLEVQFSLHGRTLPADHGYFLYSALKQLVLQNLEQNSDKKIGLNLPLEPTGKELSAGLLLSTISGIPDRDGMIYLNRASRFRLRCSSVDVQYWYRLLQNQVLDIQGHLVRLIQPKLTLPQPSETLKARLVTFNLKEIDHQDVPRYFLESCQKALDKLDVKAQAFIDSNVEGDLARRTLKIKDKYVLGYGVVVEGLNEVDSLKLQCYGMGGRKHFGCGWFYAPKEVE